MRLRLLLSAFVFYALIGCSSSPIELHSDRVLPASKASVTSLREDHDAAIARLREDQNKATADLRSHVDEADAAIRTDAINARNEGQRAFDQAVAEGRSATEALAARFRAEAAESERRMSDAVASAAGRAQQAAKEAKDMADEAGKTAGAAKTKAEAAGAEAGESTSPLGTIIAAVVALLGAFGLSKWKLGANIAAVVKSAVQAFDAEPFRDSRGRTATEEEIVAASLAVREASKAGPEKSST